MLLEFHYSNLIPLFLLQNSITVNNSIITVMEVWTCLFAMWHSCNILNQNLA